MAAPITTGFAGGLAVYYAALQLRVGLYRKAKGVRYNTVVKDSPADMELTCIRAAGGGGGGVHCWPSSGSGEG